MAIAARLSLWQRTWCRCRPTFRSNECSICLSTLGPRMGAGVAGVWYTGKLMLRDEWANFRAQGGDDVSLTLTHEDQTEYSGEAYDLHDGTFDPKAGLATGMPICYSYELAPDKMAASATELHSASSLRRAVR